MMSEQAWQADTLYVCLLLDQFPAQSIASINPALKKKAFIVLRQDPLSHKSLVWSCSVKAKQQKIRSGQMVMEVKKKFKQLQVQKQHREFEAVVLKDLKEILYELTPDFEVKENGVLLGNFSHLLLNKRLAIEEVVRELRDTVKQRVNLEEVAIGVSQSKVIARIMARLARPDSIKICRPLRELSVLKFLNCGVLPGLSPACREKLKKYGLKKIGQVLQLKRHELIRRLGLEGDKLYGIVRGIDFNLKLEYPQPLLQETVFKKDIVNQQVIDRFIRHTADKLCFLLKKKKLLADRLTFLLRYTDNRVNQRSALLPVPTNDLNLIARVFQKLFFEVYLRRVSIKSIRLIVKKPLIDFEQLKLFETVKEKKQRLLQAGIASIRNRFRFHTVFSAGELELLKVSKKKTKPPVSSKNSIKRESGGPQALSAGLADKRIFIGVSKMLDMQKRKKIPGFQKNHILTFQEIGNTRYGESIRSDFQKINAIVNKKTVCTVLANHKILQPKSLDKASGKKLIRQQMGAVSPLFNQGRFYSFLVKIPAKVIRSLEVLNYLVEIASVPIRKHFDLHLEFLHESWFTEYVLNTLKRKGIGICNPTHQTTFATTNKGYIRCFPSTIFPPDHKDLISSQISLSKKVDQLAIVCRGTTNNDAIHQVLQNIQSLDERLGEE